MEPSKRVRYFVRNHQNQPLELHLPGGVLVVSPNEEAEIREADLEHGQLRVFRKQRLVSVREEAEAADTEPAEAGRGGEGCNNSSAREGRRREMLVGPARKRDKWHLISD